MKKGFKISFLVLSGVFYLMIASGLSITRDDFFNLAELIMEFMEILISACGSVLIFNTIKFRENNRANFLAVNSWLMSIFIIIPIIIKLYCKDYYYGTCLLLTCEHTLEIGQLFGLTICLLFVNEKNSWLKWTVVLQGILVLLWFGFKAYWQVECLNKVITENSELNSMIKVAIICATFICIFMCKSRMRELTIFERQFFVALFVTKAILMLLKVYGINRAIMHVQLIHHFMQCMYISLILIYIDETTFRAAWQKVEMNVREKEVAVLQEEVNKRELVTAAKRIQNNVNIIMHTVSRMEERIRQEYEGRDLTYITKIKNNCERLFKLSHNILKNNTAADQTAIMLFKKVNVANIVKDSVASLEPYIKENGMYLDYEASSDEIMGEVNQEGLERIIFNLLSNAIKYNKPHGSIIVRLSYKKDRIYLSVKDTGIGIPEKSLQTAFQKYERIQRNAILKKEGSGLGLSIVKSLVAMHQGEIMIASKVGRGTIISINIPDRQIKNSELKSLSSEEIAR